MNTVLEIMNFFLKGTVAGFLIEKVGTGMLLGWPIELVCYDEEEVLVVEPEAAHLGVEERAEVGACNNMSPFFCQNSCLFFPQNHTPTRTTFLHIS